jgi:glyoxylase-like metal-dependent hydrolase (beta-lactamase superfamily II)
MRALAAQWFQEGRWLAAVALLIVTCALIVGRRGASTRKVAEHSKGQIPRLARSAGAVVPGIYHLGGLWPSSTYVIETSQGLVLIDSGLDDDAKLLRSQMAELGLDWKRIRAIFLTHVHGDHSGGAQWLRKATGAKVYAGEADAPVLQRGEPREAFFSTFYMPNNTPHPTTVDICLKGGENLDFGDVRIECLATPGHTPGSICYLVKRQNLRALFGGDTIMRLHGEDVPRGVHGKPLGTYAAYLAPRYRGNAKDLLDSLRKLRLMPVPDLVLPGHPGADAVPQLPCFSQRSWESLLDCGIRDMETLLSRYESDGADFLDGIPKPLLPDLYYLGDFGGTAVYAFFTSSRSFLVGAPGGSGLADFVSGRLRQFGRELTARAAILLTSSSPAEIAGLKELVEKWRFEVVAPPVSIERLKNLCPAGTTIFSAWELKDRAWFSVTPISVEGRGDEAIVFRLSWAGKTVLFSGRIPINLTHDAVDRLVADLKSPQGDVHGYFMSLTRLQNVHPNLWLPANPANGQNANLYDKEWDFTIEDNLAVVKSVMSQ